MSRKTYAPVKHSTYLEMIDEIPPAYCRLIAREKKIGCFPRMLTMVEIAEAAGMPWQRAAAIARRKSFAGVTVENADKFRKGCGITPQNEKRHMEFLKRHFRSEKSFAQYFKHSPYRSTSKTTSKKPYWKREFLDRILKRL